MTCVTDFFSLLTVVLLSKVCIMSNTGYVQLLLKLN